MAYKDKDKQREANAERQRRYKAKQKALLSKGVTGEALLPIVRTPEEEELHVRLAIEALGMRKPKPERTALGNIRVSKPGDADYDGICTPGWRAERGR